MAIRRMLAVGTHHDTYSVDLLDWRSGWTMSGVPVMTGPATGRTGNNDLPDFTEESPGLALVEEVDGAPLVMGFLHNRLSAMRFDDGRMAWRHESDAYFTVDRSANVEFSHPSGTFLSISESGAHTDLSATDHDKMWGIAKNTAKAVHFRVVVKNAGAQVASLDVDPDGNVSLVHVGNLTTNTGGNLSANVTGNASATVGGATSVNSTGNMALTAPTITLNGNIVLNGALTQGKGGNGGSCTMLGPLTVTNDVTAGGISLMTHHHTGVQPGSGNTGGPA